MSTWSRLVRFVPVSGSTPLIGEPTDPAQDVGLAAFAGEPIEVETFSGSSVLNPGERTGNKEKVKVVLSPLAQSEVGTIRCIGLNVRFHPWRLLLALRLTPPSPFSICVMPRRSRWPFRRSLSCS